MSDPMTFDMTIITPPDYAGVWLGILLILWTLYEFLPLLFLPEPKAADETAG